MWPFKKKRHKTALKNGMVNLFCTECGASMDTDLEHIQVFCPFCGHELAVPVGYLNDILETVRTKNEK